MNSKGQLFKLPLFYYIYIIYLIAHYLLIKIAI